MGRRWKSAKRRSAQQLRRGRQRRGEGGPQARRARAREGEGEWRRVGAGEEVVEALH